MKQILRVGALAGVASFVFFWLPYVPGLGHSHLSSAPGIALNLCALVLYVLYIYGLSLVGKKYHSRLFTIGAWSFIGLNVVSLLAALTTFYTPAVEFFWMSATSAVGGILEIAIGFASLWLIRPLGLYAGVYGAVAVAAGLGNLIGYTALGFDPLVVDAIESVLFLLGALLMWRAAHR